MAKDNNIRKSDEYSNSKFIFKYSFYGESHMTEKFPSKHGL